VTGARVAARLAELGLELPAVAAPVAAYVPAVRDGDLVWTSGQLPFVDGELPATGVVGDGDGLVPPEDAAHLARVCALNALAAIGSVADLDEVARIVKVVGFVASAPGFAGQPQVVNGASRLLGDIFGEAGRHARSAVGVTALPLGAPVEVEVVAALSRPAPGYPADPPGYPR
jgi:enamine deaminase RidA (YjgF/YER057c/UK114 family)